MSGYSVTFYKTCLNSEGRSCTFVQREIPVLAADSVGEALNFAVRRFEELEEVSDWRLHADSCEVVPRNDYQLARSSRQGWTARGALR